MFRKILIIALIISFSSCKSKLKKHGEAGSEGDQTTAVIENPSQTGTYQTIPDEQQAAALDRQTEQQLQSQVEEIEVQDRVLFGYDSFSINDEAQKILDTQVDWLKSDESIKILVEGHCDERGTREYNIALGEKRANAVKNYLVSHGIDNSRIKTISYGKERPAFIGSNESSFAKNRRAVTVVQ